MSIFFHTLTKLGGNGTSILVGKISSLLICPSTQSIRCETYCGAGSGTGLLNFLPSAQRYSYLVVGSQGQFLGKKMGGKRKRIKKTYNSSVKVRQVELVTWPRTKLAESTHWIL